MSQKKLKVLKQNPLGGPKGQNPHGASQGAEHSHDETDPFQLRMDQLMEAVVETSNLRRALARVKSNKGSPGIDSMPVEDLGQHLVQSWSEIKNQLLEGRYEPKPVKRVEIPKPDGGTRQLGVPTALDRFVQQAVGQVLGPIFDPTFSDSSFGFRPGRDARQAILQSKRYVEDGYKYVVDIDLERFFDKVQHDALMNLIKRRIKDARLLRLIRSFLKSGVMIGAERVETAEGTPQGGPLSPLLSNIMLDQLDRELEKRGHRFCRYADDCNIFVRTKRSGERVMSSIESFIINRLKLQVNKKKSAVLQAIKVKFLGFGIRLNKGVVKIAPHKKSVGKLKNKLRRLYRRGRGRNIRNFVREELTPVLRGWHQHFKVSETSRVFEELDQWNRRKIRCLFWRQWKKPKTRLRKMLAAGVARDRAEQSASNGRGPWWNSGRPHMNAVITNVTLRRMGLYSFMENRSKECLI